MSYFSDTKTAIEHLLDQIAVGWQSKKLSRVIDYLTDFDPQKVYPITITFKRHDYKLNDELYLQILNCLFNIHEKCYYYLCPAYQNSFVLHFHGVIIPHPEKGVGLTFIKHLRASLNKNIGWCKITNIKRDDKAKCFSYERALERVMGYAYSEDNYGGCEEYKIISNLPLPDDEEESDF